MEAGCPVQGTGAVHGAAQARSLCLCLGGSPAMLLVPQPFNPPRTYQEHEDDGALVDVVHQVTRFLAKPAPAKTGQLRWPAGPCPEGHSQFRARLLPLEGPFLSPTSMEVLGRRCPCKALPRLLLYLVGLRLTFQGPVSGFVCGLLCSPLLCCRLWGPRAGNAAGIGSKEELSSPSLV